MQSFLKEVLNNYNPEEVLAPCEVDQVVSFNAAGILTNNKGLVVTMQDGSEFQITIVKSK